MDLDAYRVVRAVYSAWTAGNLSRFATFLADDVEFRVPPDAKTFVGSACGKHELERRLRAFLDAYAVKSFRILNITTREDFFDCKVSYHYVARATGWDIDGVQRHKWKVAGGLITSFEVIHDARRLGAFFEMVERASGAA
jgi:ketosteroid isomerase-like protein